jgi:magnesium-transporting ATPase (P-type)
MAGHATLAETSRRYTRVLWWSLAVLILTGLLMIVGEPVRELINPIFWIKMVLVIVGILVAVWFAGSMRRQLTTGDVVASGAKLTAAFLVLLWCAIMFAGRWIAYAPV